MTKQTRKFGAVYPNEDLDFAVFEERLKENGGAPLAEALEFDPDPARSAEQATTFVTKLKASGVTTVVLLAFPTMAGALMQAANEQDYSPEWILTGVGYHDYPLFPRTWDQEQAAHAFGIGVLSPASRPDSGRQHGPAQVVLRVRGRARRRERERDVPRPLPGDALRGPDAHAPEREECSRRRVGRCSRRHDGVAQRFRHVGRHALRRVRLAGLRSRSSGGTPKAPSPPCRARAP